MRLGDGDEVVSQPSQVPIEPVDRRGLEQSSKSLHRVEFRAVGGEAEQPHIARDPDVARPQMKTGVVGDDYVE